MADPNLSERQQRWFASVRAGLERDTGRSLAEWVAIARTCPEKGQRAQLKWLKEHHGLLRNRAIWVLSEAFGRKPGWDDPKTLIDALWVDPAARALYEAVDAQAMALEGAIRTARKGYTAWARTFQFAALRPLRAGGAMLGLAVAPDAHPALEAPRNESWSERLKSRRRVDSAADVGEETARLLRAAFDRS